MCAILGWVGNITPKLLRRLYRASAPFGPHSVGLAYVVDPTVTRVFKRAVSPGYFLRNCNHRINTAARYQVGLGHVRFATHGAVTDENAHPFVYKGTVFVHNGIVTNHRKLNPKGTVDSECLGPLIQQRQLNRAEGSVAVAWLNHGQLNIYAHNQRLKAVTFPELGITLVVSRNIVLDDTFPAWRTIGIENTVEPGWAFKVTTDGLTPLWYCAPPTFEKFYPPYLTREHTNETQNCHSKT